MEAGQHARRPANLDERCFISLLLALYISLYHTNCIGFYRQDRDNWLHLDGIFTFRFAVVDPKHLGPLHVVETSVTVREGTREQAVDLSSVSCMSIDSRCTHLLIGHPVSHLLEHGPDLVHHDVALVAVIKAREGLEHVMLLVERQKAFTHHGKELGEVEAGRLLLGRRRRAAWSGREEALEQGGRRCLACASAQFPHIRN